ncbi:hypothetical protein Vretimale_8923, partial [Volvox reticuliferus]
GDFRGGLPAAAPSPPPRPSLGEARLPCIGGLPSNTDAALCRSAPGEGRLGDSPDRGAPPVVEAAAREADATLAGALTLRRARTTLRKAARMRHAACTYRSGLSGRIK